MTSHNGRRRVPTPVLSFHGVRAIVLFLSVFLIAAAIVVVVFRPEELPELLINNREGQRLAVVPVPGGSFDHTYIHSIHQTRVDEFFRIEGSVLRLYELRFDTLSVGMPSDAEGGYRLEDGRFVLAMDRHFEGIPIAVSPIAGHGIDVGGDLTPFTTWAPIEGSLILKARTIIVLKPRFNVGRSARYERLDNAD